MAIEALKAPAVRPAGKKSRVSAAGRGAIMAAGLITTANTALWITKPKEMNLMVKAYGGRSQYAMNLAAGIAMFSVIGAGINTILNAASKKIRSNNPPKAAN